MKWKAKDYAPTGLRTFAQVLADAKPAKVANGFRWYAAGGDWWGVNPAKGVVPEELANSIYATHGREAAFETEAAALTALRVAAESAKNRG